MQTDSVTVFEVAIGPSNVLGEYKVEVIDSPVGEADAIVDLDVNSLIARRQEVQMAILTSPVLRRQILHRAERPVREIGKELFAALLGCGDIAELYRSSAAVAGEREHTLRVVLRIDTPELAGLPWEAMYDPKSAAYVCRRYQIVRRIPVASFRAPLRVQPPLRILGVVSAPTDLGEVDADKERAQLTSGLKELISNGIVDIQWVSHATWTELQDQLLRRQWHILHFIGHGDFDVDQDEGLLALCTDDGLADFVQASRFTDLLHQARPMPRLVVLNSCSGATIGAADLFSGTAAALVRSGVSAVVAMQFEITNHAAVAFARGFYSAIATGRAVDDAVSSGRIAILGTSSRTLEWLTPVLYLRGQHHAHLFTHSNMDQAETIERPGTNDTRNPISPKLAPPPSDSRADSANRNARPSGIFQRLSEHDSSQANPEQPTIETTHPAGTLIGHSSAVGAVAFNASGTLIATGSRDQTARIWNTSTYANVLEFRGHSGPVLNVTFSNNGTLLATGSDDHTVWLWDTLSGRVRGKLLGHASAVSAVAFNPSDTIIATASFDGEVRLRSTTTGVTSRMLPRHLGAVLALAFSRGSELLATTSESNVIRLWDVASGQEARILAGHKSLVRAVTFSSDGQLLASASDDRTVCLWNIETGERIVLSGHASAVRAVTFSPDGSLIASAGYDGEVRLWSTTTGQTFRILTGHAGAIRAVALSPDGALIATASGTGQVRLWEQPS